ncbi:MAG: hypothetical protein R3F37_08910 [Candidatus Competibacteraceae bacterium]
MRICEDIATLAERTASEPEQVERLVNSARAKLLAVRDQRIWPGRDEKIPTAWNGLMIRGMAIAGRHLGRADFT